MFTPFTRPAASRDRRRSLFLAGRLPPCQTPPNSVGWRSVAAVGSLQRMSATAFQPDPYLCFGTDLRREWGLIGGASFLLQCSKKLITNRF